MIVLADSEGPDQTARMRRLIWAFAVRICFIPLYICSCCFVPPYNISYSTYVFGHLKTLTYLFLNLKKKYVLKRLPLETKNIKTNEAQITGLSGFRFQRYRIVLDDPKDIKK